MLKFCLLILQILSVSVIFLACGQTYTNGQIEYSELKFDTTKTTILELKKSLPWIFDSTYKSGKLTQYDLNIIDSLLIKSVDDFNGWQVKTNSSNAWRIDLKSQDYKKQIVVVTNKRGEKEVWVNCFCEDFQIEWKSKPVFVEDGATCFFNFKINLVTKTYYDFIVNSAA